MLCIISNKDYKKCISKNDLAFQPFDFQRTWWKLLQKRVVRTKFDIYVSIFDW
jgi:hypothetical protein